jgi:phosphate starvation-inducible PhoH-like protein
MSKKARRYKRQEKVSAGMQPTPKYQKSVEIVPQTEKQKDYLDALQHSDMVICTGCAGTGKTYVAVSFACHLYLTGQIRQIVITRPNIPAGGSTLGHFPGEKVEKMMNWMGPVLRVMQRHFGKQKVEAMVNAGEILLEPFETMRGMSFEEAFVLLDEAQNASYEELKMFLTRIGEDTITVIDGDMAQTDLGPSSGLRRVINIAKRNLLPVPVIEFGEQDIVRSDLCAMWIKAFSTEESPQPLDCGRRVA